MDVKKQIVFIVNPKSGLLDKQQILNWIEKRLNQDLFEPTFFHTEYAGHASEIAAHAARKGIFAVIAIINLFIPSGSGKALVVMPIVLPIAQIVGIEPQVAVLAYQFGDGITNMCTPLLGVLLLALGFGRVPFSKWERFILPLCGILVVIAMIFLMIAMSIGYK